MPLNLHLHLHLPQRLRLPGSVLGDGWCIGTLTRWLGGALCALYFGELMMKANKLSFVHKQPSYSWLVSIVLASLLWLFGSTAVFAAPPPANAVIGNQATASYTDGTGTSRNVTSNLVQTTVAQVYGHTLTASQTKQAPQGSTVYFPHVLTNTGNGPDSYSLSTFNVTTGDNFDLSNVQIFADANGDGQPDNATAITATGLLAAGAEFRFVVAGQVPASQTSGNQSLLRVGSSSATTSADANNYAAGASAPSGAQAGVTDTTVVTTQAVLNVTKAFDVLTGPTGTTVTVTLSYTNIGGAAATSVSLTDSIGVAGTTPNASSFTYVVGSGRWSSGAAAPVTLTDAAGGDPTGITYVAPAATGNVVATLTSVAPGDSGQVSFQIRVASGAPVGTIGTTNSAAVGYNDGSSVISATTNAVAFTVTPTRGVALQDVLASGTFNVNNTETTLTRDDSVVKASAGQGTAFDYRIYLTNSGNAVDTFNITMASSGFPAGTTFQFFNSTDPTSATSVAGSPLVDSNGDGIPDSGPVAIGATIPLFVRVQLPVSAVSNTALTAVVRATSVGDATTGTVGLNTTNPETTRDVGLTLNDIIEKQVDLSNVLTGCTASGSDNGAGFQATGESSFRCSQTAQSGQKAVFKLVIANTTGTADSYDLLGSANNSSINSAGYAASLPAGWAVEFRLASTVGGNTLTIAQSDAANCASTTALAAMPVVVNTGNVSANSAVAVCAVVTIPTYATAGTHELYFRAASPAAVSYTSPTAAFDVKHDQVVVLNDNVAALTIAPNRTGQVYPGGNVVYSHEVCNVGNATLTNINLASTMVSQTPAGWTNTLYRDNGSVAGVLDATDTVLSAGTSGTIASLAAGACVTVLNNVFAPLGAPQGAYAVQSLTATYTGGPAAGVTVTDTSQVIIGDVTLSKTQGLGTNTSGTCTALPGSYATTTISGAVPGAFVCYDVKAENTGSGPVAALNIQDVAPQYATLVVAGACAPSLTADSTVVGAPASPTVSGQSIVSGAVTTVPPQGVVHMKFCVQIQQ
jgi:hypothetical protein